MGIWRAYPVFGLDCGRYCVIVPPHSLSSKDCDGTANLEELGSTNRVEGIGTGDGYWGVRFIVRGLGVVNWKCDRREENQQYPQHSDCPMQPLHRKELQIGEKLRLPMTFVNNNYLRYLRYLR